MGIITVIAANPVYATLALAVVSVMLAVIILLDVRLAVLNAASGDGDEPGNWRRGGDWPVDPMPSLSPVETEAKQADYGLVC